MLTKGDHPSIMYATVLCGSHVAIEPKKVKEGLRPHTSNTTENKFTSTQLTDSLGSEGGGG